VPKLGLLETPAYTLNDQHHLDLKTSEHTHAPLNLLLLATTLPPTLAMLLLSRSSPHKRRRRPTVLVYDGMHATYPPDHGLYIFPPPLRRRGSSLYHIGPVRYHGGAQSGSISICRHPRNLTCPPYQKGLSRSVIANASQKAKQIVSKKYSEPLSQSLFLEISFPALNRLRLCERLKDLYTTRHQFSKT
jgi:hypothetical protein